MTRAHLVVAAVAVAALVAAAWWFWPAADGRDGLATSGARTAPPADPPADSTAGLMARLTLEPGAPGDEVLAIVSIFDGRLRNRITAEGAQVTMARDALAGGAGLEIEHLDGSLSTVSAATLVRTPADGLFRFESGTTLEIWWTGPALPPTAQRARARVPFGGTPVVSDWTRVAPPPAARVEQLVRRARQQYLRQLDVLEATATELVSLAPADARGHYYLGLAREARGDRAAAIAAYETALERTPSGQPEPPAAIYRRLEALRR